MEQGGPKFLSQPIALGVQEGVDEPSALTLNGGVQVDPDLAEGALELVQHLLQRVALAAAALGHLLGAISADDQNAGAGDA